LKQKNVNIPEANQSSKIHEDAKVLSSIGQKIISCLSVDEIISTVYEEVNKVMDATSMNLGIFNSETNRLDFPGTMEKGHKLDFHYANLDETHKLPVVCYNKEIEILINDMQTGAKKFTGHDPVSLSDDGEIVAALIYIPLYSKGTCLGVISVQSFQKNTYTEYHLDLLKNIGNYVGIAIENARLYGKMESEITTRTQETIDQKNKIEKTYESLSTLSNIGKDITSSLSVEEIIEKTYDNVNKVMDAAAFAIGVYNKAHHHLAFNGAIENGNKLPDAIDKLKKDSYAAICFNNSQKVIINSKEEVRKYVEEEVSSTSGDETVSLIYLPLKTGSTPIGVITVQSFEENAYGEYELNILETLATYTAIALENATAFEDIATLSEIGKEVSSSLDLNFVLNYLYKKVNEIMDAPIFMASSFSNQTRTLTYELCFENGARILEGISTKLNSERDSFAAWVTVNKKEIIIHDLINEYSPYIEKPVAIEGETPESLIYIPLIVEGEVIGILSIQSMKKNAYSKHHVELLRSLASYVSGAFNNAIVFKELEAARKELEQLSIVASETDNAVIIMNAEGDFEWVNKAYTRMTGYTLETLINECGSNLGTINNEITRKHFDKMLSTKKSVIYELTFLKRNNERIWIHTNLSPVLDKNNEITKIIAIDTNITERKQAELKIQEKNKDITDSINYASRIQRAMLPSADYIKETVPNSFILYKPRDIVSGDFYWMTKTKSGDTIVSVVDCTGHGVPGAFLTIVGNNLLNQIVNFNNITNPTEILSLMNEEVVKRFESSSEGAMKDGMDMSICKISQDNSEIEFAGAFSSLYHVSDNNLTEYGGSRFAVGTPLKNNPSYKLHSLSIKEGDLIYLSTDGYQDQFGGPRFKKFKKTNFNNTLLATSTLPISEQRYELNDIIEEWRGKHPQVDDILIFGIAF